MLEEVRTEGLHHRAVLADAGYGEACAAKAQRDSKPLAKQGRCAGPNLEARYGHRPG